jgi:hypothetical protein
MTCKVYLRFFFWLAMSLDSTNMQLTDNWITGFNCHGLPQAQQI